jgi:hypothetical protein
MGRIVAKGAGLRVAGRRRAASFVSQMLAPYTFEHRAFGQQVHHRAMRDFEDSTLWNVSEFERVRQQTGSSGFARLDGPEVLPTTLVADLQRLSSLDEPHGDVLEVVAACMRHREAALICLQYEGLVWPVTLFPMSMLYHSPRDMSNAAGAALGRTSLITIEPPGVRPPGHWMHERIANTEHYRPLAPLLWSLAIDGPRSTLLSEIAGTAAYRALKSPADEGVTLSGALGSAAERLRRETVSVRTIATWPGMSADRAIRLLNGLYLSAALLSTRAHPAARPEPRVGIRDMWRGSRAKR